jgi:hypothetical protein
MRKRSPNKVWTPAEEREIRQLVADGYKTKEIAAKMGVTYQMMCAQLRQMILKPVHGRRIRPKLPGRIISKAPTVADVESIITDDEPGPSPGEVMAALTKDKFDEIEKKEEIEKKKKAAEILGLLMRQQPSVEK